MRITTLSVVATALLTMASSASSATLDIRGGQLFGAVGVDVQGVLYDVAFRDGTCITVFDGCDAVSDFAFQTEDSARAAGQALLDQVFLDGPLGRFDSGSQLTNGISRGGRSQILSPFGFTDQSQIFLLFSDTKNQDGDGTDTVELRDGITMNTTLGSAPNATFARWSISAPPIAPVPLPAGGLLLLAGLLSMMGFRRHSKTA